MTIDNETEREKRITETMQATGLPRDEAEFIYDQEHGVVEGDEEVVEEQQ